MQESDLWKYLRKGMTGRWHATRIESSAGNGVPDVSFGIPNKNGWIELKYIPSWPKRPTTKVKLPLRPEQKHWIKARGELSGDVWVLVRIENDFFLLNHAEAIAACEGYTESEWKTYPVVWEYWSNRIDFNALLEILR